MEAYTVNTSSVHQHSDTTDAITVTAIAKTITKNTPKCLSVESKDNHITDIQHTATKFLC